jgi:hypothetical protein
VDHARPYNAPDSRRDRGRNAHRSAFSAKFIVDFARKLPLVRSTHFTGTFASFEIRNRWLASVSDDVVAASIARRYWAIYAVEKILRRVADEIRGIALTRANRCKVIRGSAARASAEEDFDSDFRPNMGQNPGRAPYRRRRSPC